MLSMRLINKKHYNCLETEFTKKEIKGFENLKLVNDLNDLERLVGLINDLRNDLKLSKFYSDDKSYGNFIISNVLSNNINFLDTCYEEGSIYLNIDYINFNENDKRCIVISKQIYYTYYYKLTNTDLYINVSNDLNNEFLKFFKYYLVNNYENNLKEIDYDNLIHLVIMVKNGGEEFRRMLINNYNLIDRWTILDTGSTDNTIDIINEILIDKKKGNLYQEQFINFRDSRNRSIELAGNNCKFILILDDTYHIKGNLRKVLNDIRSDQYATSYSLFIKDDYSSYGSNRIIKSDSGLRYIYRIHEVINDKNNINVIIPDNLCYIYDEKNERMNKRTNDRLQLDLKLLYEEIEDNKNDPRPYYYLGQTYNQLKMYKESFENYYKRTQFKDSGFRQELVDAYINCIIIGKYRLNIEWNIIKQLLTECFNIENTRPECPFYFGLHYYENGLYFQSYQWFKKAFEIGLPIHCQYSLRPVISYCHIPKLLAELCYYYDDFQLGLKSCETYLINRSNINDSFIQEYNPFVEAWYCNYLKLIQLKKVKPIVSNKKILCIVADGGFSQWSGSSIIKNGVGGSETWVIETASSISKLYGNYFQVIVFCNCENEEVFKNVNYYKLEKYPKFISEYYVDTCIISRFSEYLPLTYKGYTENVYLICHDLTPSNNFIINDYKLKNIFCLSEFHVEYMKKAFSNNEKIHKLLVPQYYGINPVTNKNKPNDVINFIFSSFANRGLLQVLQMWNEIYSLNNNCHLYIYCDLNNKWLNDNYSQLVKEIKDLLYILLRENLNIHLVGWVSKSELNEAWSNSHIWLYPCTFLETFCLTALECAIHKVLPITNGIGSLQNTASRGIIIEGDVNSLTWREKVIEVIKQYLKDSSVFDKNIQDNYEWASKLTWDNQTKLLMDNYIIKNRLEYKDMFNWTNNCPEGSINDFIEIIDLFNNRINFNEIQILEIGSWTGTSICALLKNINNSYGTAIDMWDNYEENNNIMYVKDLKVKESVFTNLQLYGIDNNRLKVIQGDSKTELSYLIKQNKNYDLIYVDGSHLLVDVYVDLYLSWELLKSNGIMIIDDYSFNLDKLEYDKKYITETIKYSVDKFLKEKEGNYKLLKKNYRVFLMKN